MSLLLAPVHICIYMLMCVCVYIHICLCVYICVDVYIRVNDVYAAESRLRCLETAAVSSLLVPVRIYIYLYVCVYAASLPLWGGYSQ